MTSYDTKMVEKDHHFVPLLFLLSPKPDMFLLTPRSSRTAERSQRWDFEVANAARSHAPQRPAAFETRS